MAIKRTFLMLGAAALVALGTAYVFAMHVWCLCLYPVRTSSMEPILFGPSPGESLGDIVVVSKRLTSSSLKTGSLVWARVTWGGREINIIRQIAAAPGESYPAGCATNVASVVPPGAYFLLAPTSNAIDSRVLGDIPASCIKGRAVCVIPLGFRGGSSNQHHVGD
jgi:type IV secretory pathway protease TraF